MKAVGSVAPRLVPGDSDQLPTADRTAHGQVREHNLRRAPRADFTAGPCPMPRSGGSTVREAALATESESPVDLRLVIVDDCAVHRDSLAAALAARGLPVVGGAWDLDTLVTAIQGGAAGVVLLNITMRNWAALLRAALAATPSTRVVVLGVSDEDEDEIIVCAEAGVAGYHTRAESFDDLVTLLNRVSAGEVSCPPVVSAILLRRLSALASERVPAPDELALTAREAQILDLLKLGLRNRDIADQLCIAVHTVKNHVHSVLTKLGVSTRAEAAALAHTLQPGPLTTVD